MNMLALKIVRRPKILFGFIAVSVIAVSGMLMAAFTTRAPEPEGTPSDYNAVEAIPSNYSDKEIEIPGVADDQTSKYYEVKNRILGLGSSFIDYSIEYSGSWNLKHVQKVYGTTLLLNRDGYELYINQVTPDNVGSCNFDSELVEGKYSDSLDRKDYVQIRSETNVYRRLQNSDRHPDKTFMYFCEHLSEGFDYPYVGIITYTAPKDYNPTVIKEMDNIIRSIQFLERK